MSLSSSFWRLLSPRRFGISFGLSGAGRSASAVPAPGNAAGSADAAPESRIRGRAANKTKRKRGVASGHIPFLRTEVSFASRGEIYGSADPIHPLAGPPFPGRMRSEKCGAGRGPGAQPSQRASDAEGIERPWCGQTRDLRACPPYRRWAGAGPEICGLLCPAGRENGRFMRARRGK